MPTSEGKMGFAVPYGVGGSRHATVEVSVGYGASLPFEDYQTVIINDPRLPFAIRGEVRNRRLVHLHLGSRPNVEPEILSEWVRRTIGWAEADEAEPPEPLPPLGEITQKDIQAVPLVSMIKEWAVVGREYQVALQRHTEVIHSNAADAEAIARANTEVAESINRLFKNDKDAVRRTREALSRLAARRSPGEPTDEDPLMRVVREYEDAVERGVQAPRALVAERLNYHPAHVGRLLTVARRQGLLPPAKPRGRHAQKETTERKENTSDPKTENAQG